MANETRFALSRTWFGLDQERLAGRGPRRRGGGRGRLRVGMLVSLRWVLVAGELVALAFALWVLKFDAPYRVAFALVASAAWVNVLTTLSGPGQRLMSEAEAAIELVGDLLQVAALVYLTGGTANPFVIMLITPVILAAATQPVRSVLALAGLGIAVSVALIFVHLPLPAPPGAPVTLPFSLSLGAGLANVAGIVVIAWSVRRAAEESERMAGALDMAQSILAREQRLSALDALATAAAHELGTPLATIAIVARELATSATSPEVRDDAELLVSQAARCREILRRLTEAPLSSQIAEPADETLEALLEKVARTQHAVPAIEIAIDCQGVPPLRIGAWPEVVQALTALVENSVDFATGKVTLRARHDARFVIVEIEDDGPGFLPSILSRLGEPYVTSRLGQEGRRTGRVGMGLGIFIATTLLERSGARTRFKSLTPSGALVTARWSRSRVEATLN